MTEKERFRELDKLTDWLTEQAPCYNWRVERTDKVLKPLVGALTDPITGDRTDDIGQHIVIVYTQDGERLFDAICHYGSYGYHNGLLEIMGTIVDEDSDSDSVVGYLTADDVIDRIIKTYG
ncbi:MAG: hypothetical protein IKS76_03865 [Paludibacteraceae bacterium]|nr:hypothetical protein [Paludibacteraceae bacterium]